jgi:3-oxoacyl-[acyl-carrier-protein] synthase III
VITTKAAENCLAAWNGDRNEIDLVLFAGMTRTGYIAEPAIATFIAGELKINDDVKSAADRKTLAFDVYNAALGTLNACDVAAKMIQAGKFRRALVTTSEIELNASIFPDRLFGLREAGSALLLEASTDGRTGFGSFVYRYATEHLEARMLYGHYVEGKTLSDLRVRPEIEELYLQPVRAAVDDLLEREGIKLSDITHVLPSQFSTTFNAGLAKQLDISPERIVDLSDLGGDLFTNSLPMSLQRLRGSSPTSGSLVAKPGDIGLIVNVASGIQAGCAMYYF